jgi:hypothetical protein
VRTAAAIPFVRHPSQASKVRFVNVTTDGSWSIITNDLRVSHFPTLLTFPPQVRIHFRLASRGCA